MGKQANRSLIIGFSLCSAFTKRYNFPVFISLAYTPCDIELDNLDTFSANTSGHGWIILVPIESWPGAFMDFIFLISKSTSSLQVGAK